MIRISNSVYTVKNQQTTKLADNRTKTNITQNNTTLKSLGTTSPVNKVSFAGFNNLFNKSSDLIPEVKILPGVNNDFVSKTIKQINEFSQEWLKKFKNNNYKIILSPTLSDAYESQKVFDQEVKKIEKINPKGILSATYSGNKNFFVFCDKPPYSDKFSREIVNHELSHGVVNISGLDNNQQILELIKKDVDLMIKERKLEKLSSKEREMISHYFFNKEAHLPIDDIIADVYAWNKGAGCYGSGLVMDVTNPKLMTDLFPNLSNKLKTI